MASHFQECVSPQINPVVPASHFQSFCDTGVAFVASLLLPEALSCKEPWGCFLEISSESQ